MNSASTFVNSVGDLMATWSLSRATGRAYGALLLEGTPATLDHLAEVTGLSKGQMSTSTRELVSWGLARSLAQPGSRRVLIEAVGGLETLLAASHLRTRTLVEELRTGRDLVPAGSRARERLDDVLDLFEGYIEAGSHVLRRRSPDHGRD